MPEGQTNHYIGTYHTPNVSTRQDLTLSKWQALVIIPDRSAAKNTLQLRNVNNSRSDRESSVQKKGDVTEGSSRDGAILAARQSVETAVESDPSIVSGGIGIVEICT
jgi:hypothetical protein